MFLVPRDSVCANWDANMTLVPMGIFLFRSFLLYQVFIRGHSCHHVNPQIVKAQETLSQIASKTELPKHRRMHLDVRCLHCCCASFSFYGGIWQVQVFCYPPCPHTHTHPLSPMNTTDLSTSFFPLLLLLGFASWIYRWLSFACFIIYGACSFGIVHGAQTSFWHILHRKFFTKYGKSFGTYDFVVVLLVLGMCDFVVILSCNRIKLRTSLFFNTQQTADTQERERERERERTWHKCCSHHQMICVWIWNVERKQVKWFGWEERERGWC